MGTMIMKPVILWSSILGTLSTLGAVLGTVVAFKAFGVQLVWLAWVGVGVGLLAVAMGFIYWKVDSQLDRDKPERQIHPFL